jgi:U2 small nuclear ribonucleoprotein A'
LGGFAHASDHQNTHYQERQNAKSLFLTADNLPTQLATTLSTTVSTHSKTAVTMDEPKAVVAPGKAGRLMSKEDAQRVKEAIAKATSAEEVRRLERSLKEGYMPGMDSVGA